ncbi:DUF6155 family protein [Flavobacterium humi]|uniref:Uncharacterized protein n=1 Tax=Flavobacterium humi TaxID=2562683 RepID=A0A4Z0LCT7_9FLAO|nr:DUF6155 family protein [Flavobacterium humi]TGD59687.1 hypothetical protein E4635_01770 [Flavobacterium humi]
MSKRDLKKYVSGLSKEQLQEQIIELYEKFASVKTYYDFAFNPKEDRLLEECKLKISNEYFPIRGKKAKLRRSVAQKYIKHFISLGVDPFIIADIMFYNIEIAQAYASEKVIKQELFYKSMLNSFEQAISYTIQMGILYDFRSRAVAASERAVALHWVNSYEFNAIIERLEY